MPSRSPLVGVLLIPSACQPNYQPGQAPLARHAGYQVHYTPSYASWLEQIECRFGLITQQAIRCGTSRPL